MSGGRLDVPRVSPDGHFLTEADGSPFFWLGDTAWSLVMRLDREQTEEYLADRAAKGFTLIQAVLAGGPADGLDVPSRQGAVPWIDGDPARPNPEYFDHVEWVVERAAELGLRMGLLPVWAGRVIGGYLDDGSGRRVDVDNAAVYGRYLGERFGVHGVVWILGGDTNPIGVEAFNWPLETGRPEVTVIKDFRPVYDALAGGLVAGHVASGLSGQPMISYHPTGGAWLGTPDPRTSLYFADRDWFTINMIQSCHYRDPRVLIDLVGYGMTWYGPENYLPIRAEYDSVPTRPIIDGEPRYEDLAIDVEMDSRIIAEKGYWQAYDVRHAAWQSVFAGAAGHTYGNHSIWQLYEPALGNGVQAPREDLSWRDAMQAEGAGQMRHVKDLILSRPYFGRVPDQSVIVGDAGDGEDHVGATRDRTGAFALVYCPKGRPVRVDMTKIAGPRAAAWWFDPRTGATQPIEGEFATTGTALFAPPTLGEREDWVLVLDDRDRHFAPPGSTVHPWSPTD